jgi:hypothetical protein
MTAAQKRAYVLADNKLALNAGWDDEILAIELQELADCKFEIDLAITGFSIAEIDSAIESLTPSILDDPADDELPPLEGGPPVSRLGDLWLLGDHKLYCGDCRNKPAFPG